MRVLLIHGAGGFADDQAIADGLRTHLRAAVDMPRLPEDDMSVEAWAGVVRRRLAGLDADGVVVGHSFGATIAEWVLAEQRWRPERALLLAAPDWSPEGWDVPAYVHRGPEPGLDISLHHCRDDEVVPFDHLALNAARMSSARVCEHRSGGHQFDGALEAVADDVLRQG